ncbi:hypothetical protein Tco_0345814 [Tanacetum coccineum]
MAQLNKKSNENADVLAQIQKKGFAIAALKNELRKLTGNSVNTKFAKPSILGKPVGQPLKNQSVVRQPTAFKSERPRISKPRFASQVDVNNDLSKPVTTHHLPKGRESAPAKPHHMIAPSSSRYSSNDIVHNHYLEEAKKKTHEHSRIPRNFFDSKHFVCSTCQKCVFNANHDACVIKFLKEVNSCAKVPSNKTTNKNKPIEQIRVATKPKRQIPKGYAFSIKKTTTVHVKTTTPRSCLRWQPTGRILKNVCLRWVPTGKTFASSTTKVKSEPPNGSNADITNQCESKQAFNVSAGTLLSTGPVPQCSKRRLIAADHASIFMEMTFVHISSGLVLHQMTSDHNLKTATSRQELELLFHHHIAMLRTTEKLDALRRWREMFFWVDDALVPWNFAFYTQGLLPRDERPPPGSYSMEDAELINENRIPINAYSEAFLCHMGISRNYFQSPEEVPTFIGDDGREMDLFSVVHLSKPKQVTEGVRPLRDGEEPLLESTAGRTMELVLEQPEVESTDVLAPTPLRSVPSVTVEPPRPDATSIGSSEDADVAEVDSGLKRKRATGDDGAGPSKRVRHLSLGLSTSTEEETPDASPTLAAKEVTETPPPNVEATSDSSAPVTHAAQSPPQTGPKAFEGMPVDQLMEEFDMVTAQQAALVGASESKAEAESSRSYAQNLAEEKMALLVKVEQERADAAEYKASCHWAVKYLEGGKNNHFAGLDDFRQKGGLIALGWLAAMSTLESQEVKQSFGDVVKFALARGKAEAVECNFMKEGAEGQPDYFLKPDVAQLHVPIFSRPGDILNPFSLEREIPLRNLRGPTHKAC